MIYDDFDSSTKESVVAKSISVHQKLKDYVQRKCLDCAIEMALVLEN